MEQKPVRRRKIAPYTHIQQKGEKQVIDLSLNDGYVTGYTGDITMSPYSEYIPFPYLAFGRISGEGLPYTYIGKLMKINGMTRERAEKLSKKNFTLLRLFLYTKGDREKMMLEINRWLSDSRCMSMTLDDFPYGMRGSTVRAYFSGASTPRCFGNNYSALVGNHMLVRRGADRQPCPIVMLAIPREHLLYCRMYYILNGCIPLDKCVLFIDREIDSTGFPHLHLRNIIYRKWIKPYIDTFNVDVWKVPTEWMREKCFLSDYKLSSSSIEEMKKERRELIDKFILHLKKQLDATPRGMNLEEGIAAQGIWSQIQSPFK